MTREQKIDYNVCGQINFNVWIIEIIKFCTFFFHKKNLKKAKKNMHLIVTLLCEKNKGKQRLKYFPMYVRFVQIIYLKLYMNFIVYRYQA